MITLVSVLFAWVFWGCICIVRLFILATAETHDDIYERRRKAVGGMLLIAGLAFIQTAFALFWG